MSQSSQPSATLKKLKKLHGLLKPVFVRIQGAGPQGDWQMMRDAQDLEDPSSSTLALLTSPDMTKP